MSKMVRSMGKLAVDMVSKDEERVPINGLLRTLRKLRFFRTLEQRSMRRVMRVEWMLFFKNFGVTFLSFLLFMVAYVIFKMSETTDVACFVYKFIHNEDAFSMMLSFTLAVLLEQIWNYEKNAFEVNMMREFLIGVDLFFTITGFLFYVTFGIMSSDMLLLAHVKLWIIPAYCIGTAILVTLNILSRSILLLEREGGDIG